MRPHRRLDDSLALLDRPDGRATDLSRAAAAGGIEALALGGQYVEILTRYGNVQTLVSSTFVRCIEKVVTRSEARRRRYSGDCGRRFDARVRRPDGHEPDSVGRLAGQRPAGSAKVPSAARLSVDRGRLAVLGAEGRIDVLQDDGVLRTLEQTGARALALRGNELTVITRTGTLDTYALWSRNPAPPVGDSRPARRPPSTSTKASPSSRPDASCTRSTSRRAGSAYC